MTEHPSAIRLEELAAGDGDGETRGHVQACAECRAYVEHLAAGAQEFAQMQGASAEQFVEAVRARHVMKSGVRWRTIAWIGGPLAAAAAVLLYLSVPSAPQHGITPSVVVSGMSAPSASRFKGRLQVAVVRDRAGVQDRSTGPVAVRAGDRLRVEVGVDVPAPIEAGVLGKDGTWVELLAPRVLGQGTHYSEQSVRFDESPTDGWVLVGSPDAVEKARISRDFSAVIVVPVTVEPRP